MSQSSIASSAIQEKQSARKSTGTITSTDPNRIPCRTKVRESTPTPSEDSGRYSRDLTPDTSSPATSRSSSIARCPIRRKITSIRNSLDRTPEPSVTALGRGIGKGGIRRVFERMNMHRMRRFRQDCLGQLRRVQRRQTIEQAIPLAPFCRLIKDITSDTVREKRLSYNVKLQAAALNALRESAEAFMINYFEKCSLFTAHAKRVTLMPKDLELASRIKDLTSTRNTRP